MDDDAMLQVARRFAPVLRTHNFFLFGCTTCPSRLTTELSSGWLAEADHGHFINDGQLLAYQVPPATRPL